MNINDTLLEALKVGIIVKRYPTEGGYNIFYGDELLLIYHHGEYQLLVQNRGGMLAAHEYGTVWVLRPEDTVKQETDQDELFEDLYLENFQ